MVIGVAGFKNRFNNVGEGSGRTTFALAMYYHLLKDEYKNVITFDEFRAKFKFKEFRDKFTPDCFITSVVFTSNDIILKEIMQILLGCNESDLYDKDFLTRPIKYLQTNNIYRNNKKQRAIANGLLAKKFIRSRQGDVKWEAKNERITPLNIYNDLKNVLYTNIHHKLMLYKTLSNVDLTSTLIITPSIENVTDFELVQSLKGKNILINNPNEKSKKTIEAKDKALLYREFDFTVNNCSDIENLFNEAHIILNDILNER